MKLENNFNFDLPQIAIEKYIKKNLIEEIMLTNDIEGIYSTKKEIKEALTETTSSNKQRRFIGLVKKYEKLITKSEILLNNCDNIRSLYDEIVSNEIDEKDSPDGKIFRKSEVSVYSPTDKEKHRGIYPESKLIDFMRKSLEILHDDKIPYLIRICLFHYLFGYAHPFYDGNGRVSRFISSYLLNDKLNILLSLRLSYTIKNNKSSYYNAFNVCNDKKNKGDLTPFILMFLDIIEKSELNLIENIQDGVDKLKFYHTAIGKIDLTDTQKDILFILTQNTLFGDEGMSINELVKACDKGNTKIREDIKQLQNNGIPIIAVKSGKKLLYTLDLDGIESLIKD